MAHNPAPPLKSGILTARSAVSVMFPEPQVGRQDVGGWNSGQDVLGVTESGAPSGPHGVSPGAGRSALHELFLLL